MPVVRIRCPQCRSDFVDSRIDWKDDDTARCPKCAANVAVPRSEVDSAVNEDGRVVHAETVVATPPDRAL